MSLDYPEGEGGEIFLETKESIHGLTIHRPGTGRVFSDVLSLMKKAGLILYWPGGNSLTVHDLSLVSHLPPDMLMALGSANLVSSGDEILAAIRRS